MWRSLGPALANRPELARAAADALLADPLAEDEYAETMLLTIDEQQWKATMAHYRATEYQRTGMVKTGSIFDELEAETGGNVTPEAVEAFLARKRAGVGRG